MAEFPGFGRHCSFADCHRLDFLPIRCDACNKDFCTDHYSYYTHGCDKSRERDVQVPVCPLCGKVVPIARGQLPDGPMNEHIETGCLSNPGQSSRGQIYKYRCSVEGCKRRELIQMKCSKCNHNFCVSHRLPFDHKCTIGLSSSSNCLSLAGKAAISRQRGSMAVSTSLPAKENQIMPEDEAFARALHISINGEEPGILNETDNALIDGLKESQSQFQVVTNNKPKENSVTGRCKIF